MKIFSTVFLCALLLVGVAAGLDAPADDDANQTMQLDDMFFSGPDNTLTEKEKQAVRVAQAWQRGEIIAHNPVHGQDGSIE